MYSTAVCITYVLVVVEVSPSYLSVNLCVSTSRLLGFPSYIASEHRQRCQSMCAYPEAHEWGWLCVLLSRKVLPVGENRISCCAHNGMGEWCIWWYVSSLVRRLACLWWVFAQKMGGASRVRAALHACLSAAKVWVLVFSFPSYHTFLTRYYTVVLCMHMKGAIDYRLQTNCKTERTIVVHTHCRPFVSLYVDKYVGLRALTRVDVNKWMPLQTHSIQRTVYYTSQLLHRDLSLPSLPRQRQSSTELVTQMPTGRHQSTRQQQQLFNSSITEGYERSAV